jgi:hypothetical protein
VRVQRKKEETEGKSGEDSLLDSDQQQRRKKKRKEKDSGEAKFGGNLLQRTNHPSISLGQLGF